MCRLIRPFGSATPCLRSPVVIASGAQSVLHETKNQGRSELPDRNRGADGIETGRRSSAQVEPARTMSTNAAKPGHSLEGSDLQEFDPRRRTKAKPFVKWAGGKGILLPILRRFYPSSYGTYLEPFLGGGAVFFDLRPKSAILSDSNEELINAYKTVQNDTEALIEALRELEQSYRRAPKRTFYAVRDSPVEWSRTNSDRAGRFIFLNRTCYNGLYRVNKSGKFNVPFGEYDHPTICDSRGIRAASQALQGVVLRHLDYLDALDLVESGDFVYLDPPYHPVSQTANFTSYTSDAFEDTRHAELAVKLAQITKREACKVLLNSSDVQFISDLYSGLGFTIKQVTGPRRISCKPSTRLHIRELIIRNYTEADE